MKEFKDFQEFYNYGYNLVSNIKSKLMAFLLEKEQNMQETMYINQI